MLRFSESEFADLLSRGRCRAASVTPSRTDVAPVEPNRIERAIASLAGVPTVSSPDGVPGWCVLPGARLLTLNELLRLDHRRLHRYRTACHAAAARMVPRMGEPVDSGAVLHIYRQARRMVDNDALPGMFKFLIDGLRLAGLFPDDNPRYLRSVVTLQAAGEAGIGMRLARSP